MKKMMIALMLISTTAAAHEWYPKWCCNDKDCRVISNDKITQTSEGVVINATGEKIPWDQVQPSPDDDIHWCSYGGAYNTFTVVDEYDDNNERKTMCIWLPTGMS